MKLPSSHLQQMKQHQIQQVMIRDLLASIRILWLTESAILIIPLEWTEIQDGFTNKVIVLTPLPNETIPDPACFDARNPLM